MSTGNSCWGGSPSKFGSPNLPLEAISNRTIGVSIPAVEELCLFRKIMLEYQGIAVGGGSPGKFVYQNVSLGGVGDRTVWCGNYCNITYEGGWGCSFSG